MKKKFINGLLMAASFVVATGSFVSCTDREDDRVQEVIQAIMRDDAVAAELVKYQSENLDSLKEALAQLRKDFEKCCKEVNEKLANYVTISQFDQTVLNINNKFDNYYTKSEVFTKEELNNMFDQYYNKQAVLNLLNQYYTQEQIDKLFKDKLDDLLTKAQVEEMLEKYYDKQTIEEKLKGLYTKEEVQALLKDLEDKLGDKVDQSQIETIVNNLIKAYFDQLDLSELLKSLNLYTKAEIDALLASKADAKDVYTKDEITAMFMDVYSKTEVDQLIVDFVKKGEVVDIVLAQVKDAESEISKAIENNVIKAIKDEKFGTGTNQMTIDQLVDAYTTIEQTLNTVKADAAEALKWINDNKETFNTLITNVNNLTTNVNNMLGDINGIKQDISDIKDDITEVKGDVTTLTTTVTNLNTLVTNLNTTITNMQTQLNTVETTANNAAAAAAANSTAINSLQTRTDSIINALDQHNDDLTARIDSLAKEGKALSDRITQDSIEAAKILQDLKDAMDQANQLVTQQINSLKDADDKLNERIDSLKNANNVTFGEIRDAFKDADEKLQKQINDLKDRVDAVEERLDKVEDAIEGLTNTFKNTMAKLITSVIIQGTENPIIGSFALPVDMQSNILAGYYGYAKDFVAFPSRNPNFFANKDDAERITVADLQAIGQFTPVTYNADTQLTSDVEDNAGTLYVTVNPNTADFEGTKFTLVNSLDEEGGIQIGKLKHSDHKLTFGYEYTRGASNAFYEAPAKLVDPYKALPKVDVAASKEAAASVKTLLTRTAPTQDRVNATNLAKSLFKIVRSADIDRFGLKATWTDDQGEHSTYSQYNIAAVSMRGLSYGFAQEYSVDHVPGLDRIQDFIGKAIDRIAGRISLPELNVVIKDFDLSGLSVNLDRNGKDYKLEYTITIDKSFGVDIPSIKVTIPQMEAYSFQTNSNGDYANASTAKTETVDDGHGNSVTVTTYDYVTGSKDCNIKKNEDDGGNWWAYHDDGTPWFPVVHIATTITQEQTLDSSNISYASDGSVQVKFEYPIEFHINDLVDDIYGQANSQLGNVDDMIKYINGYMANVIDQLKDLQDTYDSVGDKIDDAVGKVKAKIAEYLDKLNDRLYPYLTPNKWLQPVLLINGQNNFGFANRSKYLPTVVGGNSFSMVMTSYTAELLAPAFKKFVAVTNVYNADRSESAQGGNAELKAALNAVNQGEFKTVLPGERQLIKFNADSRYNGKGYIYEILYTALDYNGKIAARKFYVKVK